MAVTANSKSAQDKPAGHFIQSGSGQMKMIIMLMSHLASRVYGEAIELAHGDCQLPVRTRLFSNPIQFFSFHRIIIMMMMINIFIIMVDWFLWGLGEGRRLSSTSFGSPIEEWVRKTSASALSRGKEAVIFRRNSKAIETGLWI